MDIEVLRDVFTDGYTLGVMSVNGQRFGYTCEDKDRELEADLEHVADIKVPGQTAIPKGKYEVVLSFSHHFQRVLPELLNVPGFAGIRIHGGNTAADTEGCILVGAVRTTIGCASCAPTLERLIAQIQAAEDVGEKIWLETK